MQIVRMVATIHEKHKTFQPSPEELAACPENFTCFQCLEKFPQKKLGGRVCGEWICSRCRPWVDDRAIAGLVRFDLRDKKNLKTVAKPGSVEPASPEDGEVRYKVFPDGTEFPRTSPHWERTIPKRPNTHETKEIKVGAKKLNKIQKVRDDFALWRDS